MRDPHNEDTAAFKTIDDPIIAHSQTEVARHDSYQHFNTTAWGGIGVLNEVRRSVQQLRPNLRIKPLKVPGSRRGTFNGEGGQVRARFER